MAIISKIALLNLCVYQCRGVGEIYLMVNASLKKEFCVCKPILNGCSFLSNDYLIRLFNSNKSSLVYKI